jgi:phospholipase C
MQFDMNTWARPSKLALAMCLAGIGCGSAVAAPGGKTATPIKHVVVIFQENVSFDHYFGTYPLAENPRGEPRFVALPGTPTVNGLNEELLNNNPNSENPQRLGPDQALTCDQDHHYTDEQKAFHGGLMDKFVEFTNKSDCDDAYGPDGLVMD